MKVSALQPRMNKSRRWLKLTPSAHFLREDRIFYHNQKLPRSLCFQVVESSRVGILFSQFFKGFFCYKLELLQGNYLIYNGPVLLGVCWLNTEGEFALSHDRSPLSVKLQAEDATQVLILELKKIVGNKTSTKGTQDQEFKNPNCFNLFFNKLVWNKSSVLA